MLPKKFRLTVSEFNLIPQKSTSVNAAALGIKIKKPRNRYPRFAVIVPKSLDKRSTMRHKTQRIIMQAIEKKLKNMQTTASILLLAKKILRKKDLTQIERELENLFQKSYLL